MLEHIKKAKVLLLICLTLTLVGFASTAHSDFASAQNSTLMQSTDQCHFCSAVYSHATNVTNIVLVHGLWADGSSWSKVIPILQNSGHRVIVVQLPLHSLADDVATVKRAIDLIGGPVILVGHSYGGFVITNAGYNNPNVKGLVYVAPREGQSLSSFPPSPKEFEGNPLLIFDKGGFGYINPTIFHDYFAQDVDPAQANILAVEQKPANLSGIVNDKSGPPAWKQLPTWYQVSENDHAIPPALERMFAKQMNATTISLPSSHASLVSQPDEIAQLILMQQKELSSMTVR
jgi:pimeloyl-ACP methyl ester carboxylesterase